MVGSLAQRVAAGRLTWLMLWIAPLLAGVLLLAGCDPGDGTAGATGTGTGTDAGSAPGSGAGADSGVKEASPFPPRPANLSVGSLDPCTILNSDAQRQLDVQSASGSNQSGDPTCLWTSEHGDPANWWQFQLVSRYGATAGLALAGARMTQVDGFGSVETPGLDFGTSCRLWVDIAPGQNLNVMYSNSDGTRRDIDHQLACELSKQGADVVIQALSRLAGVHIPPYRPPAQPWLGPAPVGPPSTLSFPPRPAALRIFDLDPCALLAPGPARTLAAQNITSVSGPVNYCRWKQTSVRGGSTWTARLITYRGAGVQPPGARPASLQGYGVAESADPKLGPDVSCRLSVDVADQQSLEVDYESVLNDNPAGMNHQVACERAYQMAGPILGNLRARQR
ncbi:MAG TPA: DUF3558 family protein [Pseudonocardia sp.]